MTNQCTGSGPTGGGGGNGTGGSPGNPNGGNGNSGGDDSSGSGGQAADTNGDGCDCAVVMRTAVGAPASPNGAGYAALLALLLLGGRRKARSRFS